MENINSKTKNCDVISKPPSTFYFPLSNSGFSLLETIVAISILMVTIVGPLALASKGIVFANYVKDEITAFYLAQEALEAIRNIRDTNIKNNLDWLAFIKDSCMSSDLLNSVPCRIDIWRFNESKAASYQTDHGLQRLNGDVNKFEQLQVVDVGSNDTPKKLYGYEFNTNILSGRIPSDSIFSRSIIVTNVTKDYLERSDILQADRGLLQFNPPEPDEVNVKVEVRWFRGIIPRKIQVSENLFSI